LISVWLRLAQAHEDSITLVRVVIAPQLAFILVRHARTLRMSLLHVVSNAIEDGDAGLGETASPFNMRFIYQDREAGSFIPDTASLGHHVLGIEGQHFVLARANLSRKIGSAYCEAESRIKTSFSLTRFRRG
jgi:hypothetical protein